MIVDMKKDKFKNLVKEFKIIFNKFPLTLITIIALTVFYAIIIGNDFIEFDVVKNITIFGFNFGITCFFIESTFEKKSKEFKGVSYILNIVLATLITLGFNQEKDLFGISSEKILEYVARFMVCYLISLTIYAITKNYKKSGNSFSEYVTKVEVNMFKTTIVYELLAVGLMLVCSAALILLFDRSHYMLLARTQILLLGLYYIPKMLSAFLSSDEEVNKFAKIVIKYVLGTLVFAAFVIIYLYIFKLILLRQMPSNQIFRICAGLFILGCPIWTMASYFKDEDIYQKINENLPFAFIPFIFLQIYSIGTRILNYGLTPLRYLCLALIIFEIIYVVIYKKSKEKMEIVFFGAIIIILVSGLVPYVNMFKLSEISQYNNLKIVKQKTPLTDKEKKKAKGAYNYLLGTSNGPELINKLLTESDKEELDVNDNYNYYTNKREYLYGNNKNAEINIENYNKLYKVSESDYSIGLKIDDFKNIKLNTENNTKVNVDIKNLIEDYINHNKSFESYFKKHNEYVIDGNRKLVVESISITYIKDTDTIDSYSINGYLLTK